MENISSIVEALLLASESPVTVEKICSVLDGAGKKEVEEAIAALMAGYDERASGISIQEIAGGYQLRTRPELAVWVKKLKGSKPATLSPAALETLAIVAYRQPIVKADIEHIRGVDVSAPLKGLLEKKLIRIVGRMDVPGKPIIYGTTKKFLEVFNLKELADLPTMRELKELTEHQEIPEQETIDFDEAQSEVRDALRQEADRGNFGETATPPPPDSAASPAVEPASDAAIEPAPDEPPTFDENDAGAARDAGNEILP
ncbi:MAG: SMC-Scp complex subunit ScpB [Syntrophaceae bacterium]|nr:SMC-Scp complex subunit ScpB [Syntrophaceae bacterium]